MGLDLDLTKKEKENESIEGFCFVYPFGCSLSISKQPQKEARNIPILSSGTLSFPVKESLLVLHHNPVTKGRILVSGSFKIFTDEYLNKEENMKLVDLIFDSSKETCIEQMKSVTSKQLSTFQQRKYAPSIEKLSENLKSAIEANPDLSSNVFSLFENNLFKVHFDLQKEAVQLHKKLNVERKSR